MKQLAVTADDFGLNPKLDEGIRRASVEGVITHVSVVANGDSMEEAVSFLKNHSEISASVHLNLTDGRPLSHPRDLRGLLNSEGNFFGSHWKAGWILSRDAHLLEAIEREYRMQIERVLSSGIKILQLNCHGHLHALPPLFRRVVQLAIGYKIPFVRVVNDWPRPSFFLRSARRGLETVLLAAGFRAGRRRVPETRQIQLNRCLGVFDSGHLSEKRLREILRRLPEGFSELVCHPGLSDKGLEARYRWNYHWEKELAVLTSPQTKEAFERFDIQRVNFAHAPEKA